MKANRLRSEDLPPDQQRIRARCVHPTGRFVEMQAEVLERSVASRFEEQARSNPGRLAVKEGERRVTYEQLNARANRIAHSILERNGEASQPIALLLENDTWMIAAILGVLKSGRTYVPLDPSYPRARLEHLLADSRPALMLASRATLELAKESSRETIPVLDVERMTSAASERNPGLDVSTEALSYILYTSGSTGAPKGVVQSHRGQLHDARNYTHLLHVCSEDRFMLLTSYTQLGVQVMSAALLNGASVFPLDPRLAGSAFLADWLIRERITIFRSTATFFRSFSAALTGDRMFPDLRVVRLGGEPVYRRDHELFKQRFSSNCIFCNALATTETGAITELLLDRDSEVPDSRVAAGYAVEGSEILLLDDAGEPVGGGEIGEIAIRSRYHSPGYWRQPALTDESYLPDPLGSDARIYLTGDVGRFLSDGCLLHLGRRDHQVQIRGFRVEVAEVELALLAIANVKETVVTAWEDEPGDTRLVAYVVAEAEPAPNASELRESLAGALPDYMLPAAFVILDALPQTPNGKVDRAALPPPPTTRPQLAVGFVAPRTPTEVLVAECWTRALGIEQVGVYDFFHDLGGDSLLAIVVAADLRKQAALDLQPKDLFLGTVGQIATSLDEKLRTAGRAESRSIRQRIVGSIDRLLKPRAARPETAPTAASTRPAALEQLQARSNLTKHQLGIWAGYRSRPDSPIHNMATTLAVGGPVDRLHLQRAFRTVVNSADVLRTVISEDAGVPQQRVLDALPFEMGYVDLSQHAEPRGESERWIAERSRAPFRLEQRPFDTALLKLAEDRFVWYVNQHQIVSDATSYGLLLRHVHESYAASIAGRPEQELALPRFADYVEHERKDRQSPLHREAESYWKRKLLLATDPIDFGGPVRGARTTRIRRLSTGLLPQQCRRLESIADDDGTVRIGHIPLLSVFLALLGAFVHRVAGARRFCIGTTFHNRPLRAFKETLGPFLQVLPIRLEVSAAETFAGLMTQARTDMFDSLKNGRHTVDARAYDVMLNYSHQTFLDSFHGFPAEFTRVHSGHELDSLSLHIHDFDASGQLTLDFEFRRDIFDDSACERHVESFRQLIADFARDPTQRIAG